MVVLGPIILTWRVRTWRPELVSLVLVEQPRRKVVRWDGGERSLGTVE